jgi:hypothetical protein
VGGGGGRGTRAGSEGGVEVGSPELGPSRVRKRWASTGGRQYEGPKTATKRR